MSLNPNEQRRHEVIGVVTEVGSKVEKFKVGDKVGAGFLVGSIKNPGFAARKWADGYPLDGGAL